MRDKRLLHFNPDPKVPVPAKIARQNPGEINSIKREISETHRFLHCTLLVGPFTVIDMLPSRHHLPENEAVDLVT